MDRIGRRFFSAGDASGDFREHHEAQIVVGHPAFLEDADSEVAHHIVRGLALHEDRRSILPVDGSMVFGDIGLELCELGEDRAGFGRRPRDLAGGKVAVELVAVGAQAQVIEDPGDRPERRRTGGHAVDAGGLELLAIGKEFGPVHAFRTGRRDTRSGVSVAVKVDAPLIVGVGDRVLLAIDRGRQHRRGQRLVQPVVGPDVRDVGEKARLDKGTHPVGGIPVRQIRRICGQKVANRVLVGLVVEIGQHHVDLGVGRLEVGDQGFCRGQRNRVVVRIPGHDTLVLRHCRGGHEQRRHEGKRARL